MVQARTWSQHQAGRSSCTCQLWVSSQFCHANVGCWGTGFAGFLWEFSDLMQQSTQESQPAFRPCWLPLLLELAKSKEFHGEGSGPRGPPGWPPQMLLAAVPTLLPSPSSPFQKNLPFSICSYTTLLGGHGLPTREPSATPGDNQGGSRLLTVTHGAWGT